MATAHILFGKVRGGLPAIRPVGEETVAGGSSATAPEGTSVARVTATDAALYAYIDSNSTKRAYVGVLGGFIDLDVQAGEVVHIVTA